MEFLVDMVTTVPGGTADAEVDATRWRDDRTVTLHNLSAESAKVRLPDDVDEPGQGRRMRQMLGDTDPPYRPGEEISLGRYGFRWLRQTD